MEGYTPGLSFMGGHWVRSKARNDGIKRDNFSFYIFGFFFFVIVSIYWIVILKIVNKTLMFKVKPD